MDFIHQPSETNRLGDFLNENLSGSWSHFRAAVAFAKRSGVRHIEAGLASFASNKDVEIIVGIDHRGTSYEGLKSLLDSVSPTGSVIVFHNPILSTFHPKIFLFKSAAAADVVVGSGNLTGGGLFANYEAGLRLRLDLAYPADAALLQHIEQVLDLWADQSTGTARLLDASLLSRLTALGLTPSEQLTATLDEPNEQSESNVHQEGDEFPFTARAEPGVPHVPYRGHRTRAIDTRVTEEPTEGSETSLGFVMTLQQTDVGVGQTTTGTSRRSPEIFIPLAARDADAAFWKWPDGFVEDPNTPGKLDRRGVKVRMAGETINVNMMTWPARHDFRLRSEALRSAGNVGDILRIERAVDPNADYEYYVEVIPLGTTQHPVYLRLCDNTVRNSRKRFGYY